MQKIILNAFLISSILIVVVRSDFVAGMKEANTKCCKLNFQNEAVDECVKEIEKNLRGSHMDISYQKLLRITHQNHRAIRPAEISTDKVRNSLNYAY